MLNNNELSDDSHLLPMNLSSWSASTASQQALPSDFLKDLGPQLPGHSAKPDFFLCPWKAVNEMYTARIWDISSYFSISSEHLKKYRL